MRVASPPGETRWTHVAVMENDCSGMQMEKEFDIGTPSNFQYQFLDRFKSISETELKKADFHVSAENFHAYINYKTFGN